MELTELSIPSSVRADETLADVWFRLRAPTVRTGVPFIDTSLGGKGFLPGEVIEISGDAGCGKSAILLQVVAALLAVASTPPMRVAIFDLDGRFRARNLARTVAGALFDSNGGVCDRGRLDAMLARVDIYMPRSALDCAAVL